MDAGVTGPASIEKLSCIKQVLGQDIPACKRRWGLDTIVMGWRLLDWKLLGWVVFTCL